ncbi:MAG TPA: hypothetical protein VIT62_14545 [Lysobacter sp.]
MNAVVRLPREDYEYLARERANEALRSDRPRMIEIVCKATDIWEDNWLADALVHALRTGDWQYVKRACDNHIEPDLLDALEQDLERLRRDPR